MRDFEREKTGTQRDKSKHHQRDRVNKQRFVGAVAAPLPSVVELLEPSPQLTVAENSAGLLAGLQGK